MNEIPFPETPQSPGTGNGVGNNNGSAAGTSITAGLPPSAAGSLSHTLRDKHLMCLKPLQEVLELCRQSIL